MPTTRSRSKGHQCSFCEKYETDSNRLVAGPGRVFICHECVKACKQVIDQSSSASPVMAQTLAKILDVPFAIADATSLTESGYVGEDVENILLRLIQAADWDMFKAEQGIIYIDEIDKIAKKRVSTGR